MLMRCLVLIAVGVIPRSIVKAEPVDYARDVLPILETYCVACHTSDDPSGGFALDSHESLLKGGETGNALTPGMPSSSRMLLMASGKLEPVMPPDGEEGPSVDELALLAKWIEQGAAGPEGDLPVRRELRTPDIPTAEDVTRPITAVAQSPDGRHSAIARFANVTVQDESGQVVRLWDDFPGKVNSLEFSRNGGKLLVGSGLTGAFGEAKLIDLNSGDAKTFTGHRDTLYAARLSPDGNRIATGGYDRDVLLWDVATGKTTHTLKGHNGAIFDLAFSPDGKVLVSGSADETVKVWNVSTGQRLDTLSQPEGEVYAVGVTEEGREIYAASADNRLRAWRLTSIDEKRINPILATRFADESPLVALTVSVDGMVALVSQAGNVKLIDTEDWTIAAALPPVDATPSDIAVDAEDRQLVITLMDGRIVRRDLPETTSQTKTAPGIGDSTIEPIYMTFGTPTEYDEADLDARDRSVNRNAVIEGVITEPGQVDRYDWRAAAGEVWAIDADAIGSEALDPVIAIEDEAGQPVVRVRLQAIRDSYFTFRGKDSMQINDFRLFAWQEMNLNDYLYASGEVTKLWMHPRGPDSGFNVYPGEGSRWTYFGTNHATHALGEPAYVVRPLAPGEAPLSNGLPVFPIEYQNDDDPSRRAGKNSRLLFTAPADGRYTIAIADTRGEGGDEFAYRLRVRAATPGFEASVTPIEKPLFVGAGREFLVHVDRKDGFEGDVVFDVRGLPEGVRVSTPVIVQAGQRTAAGIVWIENDDADLPESFTPKLTATARVLGKHVELPAGKLGKLTRGDSPKLRPEIEPTDDATSGFASKNEPGQPWTLTVHRGETVTARVKLNRAEGFNKEVSLGKENAARNASHGLIVDNIGLNGLLILEGDHERQFFITADPETIPGIRMFHLKAEIDGGITSLPIRVDVK